MVPDSPLDDARTSEFAWARYKWLMKLMGGVTLTVVVLSLILLYRINGSTTTVSVTPPISFISHL